MKDSLLRVQRKVAARSGARQRAWLASAVLGTAAGLWVLVAPTFATAAARWSWTAVTLFAVAMLRVPFAVFWRPDAALLSRLPIPGRALWRSSLAACVDLAAQALAASSLAAVPLVIYAQSAGARALALALTLAIVTSLLLPAVAVAAGALVVSGKAEMLLGGLGGEVKAPPTAWLGMLPGLAAAAAILLAIDLHAWIGGGTPEVGSPLLLLATAWLGAGAGALWAGAASARVMPAILRDVSALDRQQLATIQTTPASGLTRLAGRLLAPRARLLLLKHARLMSRRYPMAQVVGVLVAGALLVSALAAPAALPLQGAALGGALVYALVLRARLAQPPIELPRLRSTLPLGEPEIRAAGTAYLAVWWSWAALVPGALVLVRAPEPLQLALALLVASGALVIAARR